MRSVFGIGGVAQQIAREGIDLIEMGQGSFAKAASYMRAIS